MNSVLTFYSIFLFVVQGVPVVIQDPNDTFSSSEECLEDANEKLFKFYVLTADESEKYATAVCLVRDYSSVSDS